MYSSEKVKIQEPIEVISEIDIPVILNEKIETPKEKSQEEKSLATYEHLTDQQLDRKHYFTVM